MKNEQSPKQSPEETPQWTLKDEIQQRSRQELTRNLEAKRRAQTAGAQPHLPAEPIPTRSASRTTAAETAAKTKPTDSGPRTGRRVATVAGCLSIALVLAGLGLLTGRLRSAGQSTPDTVLASPVNSTSTLVAAANTLPPLTSSQTPAALPSSLTSTPASGETSRAPTKNLNDVQKTETQTAVALFVTMRPQAGTTSTTADGSTASPMPPEMQTLLPPPTVTDAAPIVAQQNLSGKFVNAVPASVGPFTLQRQATTMGNYGADLLYTTQAGDQITVSLVITPSTQDALDRYQAEVAGLASAEPVQLADAAVIAAPPDTTLAESRYRNLVLILYRSDNAGATGTISKDQIMTLLTALQAAIPH